MMPPDAPDASLRDSWLALAHVVEPGDAAVGRFVEAEGAAAAVERIADGSTGLRSGPGLQARLATFDAGTAQADAARCGARILTRGDRSWPTQLADLGEAQPFALWVAGAGDLRLLALRSIAVVGARACTLYGEQIAYDWSCALAARGWTVISGAAVGIDGAAHRGALAACGVTVAATAGGVDVPYPASHAGLLGRIREDGLVVSETPPGEHVRRQRFLSRNRIIAALGRATLVVEAAMRSGTTATARFAASMNRPVLAVPGPVTSATSAGCHRMFRDGEAVCVVDADDVASLVELDAAPPDPALPSGGEPPPRAAAWDRLAGRERRVLDALPRRRGLDLGAVVAATGFGPADVIAALAVLEAHRLARLADGRWRACPG